MNGAVALKEMLSHNTTISMFDNKPDTVERLETIWSDGGFKTNYFDDRIRLEELIEGLLDPGDTEEKVIPAFDVKFDTSFDVHAGTKSYRIKNPQLAGVEIVEFLTRNFQSLKDICFILMSSAEAEEEVLGRVTSLNKQGVHVSFISKHESENVILEKTFALIEGQSVGTDHAKQIIVSDDLINAFYEAQKVYEQVSRSGIGVRDRALALDPAEVRDLIASRALEAIASLGKEMQLGAIEHAPLLADNTFNYRFALEILQNIPIRVDFLQQFLASLQQKLVDFLNDGGLIQGSWGKLLQSNGGIIFELAAPPIEPEVNWQKPDSIESF